MITPRSGEPSKGDFWTAASAVRRYRDARPYFHPHVMALVREKTAITGRLQHGVDVACGTGQSSTALAELAERVTAIDSSRQMLEHAQPHPRVEYLYGAAENLPVADSSAEIITVAVAIHWFDLPRFLAEAARVLKPGGWLVSYSNAFRAQMAGNPAFREWCGDVYGVRYPTPPRKPADPPETMFSGSAFDLPVTEQYENSVEFTLDQLVAYLMTHSNVIAKVEQGEELAEDVERWLRSELAPLFTGNKQATFLFGGAVTYARLGSKD